MQALQLYCHFSLRMLQQDNRHEYPVLKSNYHIIFDYEMITCIAGEQNLKCSRAAKNILFIIIIIIIITYDFYWFIRKPWWSDYCAAVQIYVVFIFPMYSRILSENMHFTLFIILTFRLFIFLIFKDFVNFKSLIHRTNIFKLWYTQFMIWLVVSLIASGEIFNISAPLYHNR